MFMCFYCGELHDLFELNTLLLFLFLSALFLKYLQPCNHTVNFANNVWSTSEDSSRSILFKLLFESAYVALTFVSNAGFQGHMKCW